MGEENITRTNMAEGAQEGMEGVALSIRVPLMMGLPRPCMQISLEAVVDLMS